MNTKICLTCKIEKFISEFTKAKEHKDRLSSYCKKCQKVYREEHKEEIKEYQKKYLKKSEVLDNSIIGELERDCREYSKKHNKHWDQKGRENYQKNFLIIQPKSFFISKAGYKMLNFGGYCRLEHLWIMERHMRRLLKQWEQVHHKNRNPLDNRIENLELRPHNSDDHTRAIITRLLNENQNLRERIKELENS